MPIIGLLKVIGMLNIFNAILTRLLLKMNIKCIWICKEINCANILICLNKQIPFFILKTNLKYYYIIIIVLEIWKLLSRNQKKNLGLG